MQVWMHGRNLEAVSFRPHPSAAAVLERDAPATEKAYQVVLSAVVAATAAPGELLSEVDVAAELGLSRTPVRTAFVRLASEGLLTLYPRRGAVVTPVDDEQARDLLDTRFMFETTAVGWLAERGVPDGLRPTLDRCLAEQERAVDGDPLAFAGADRAFHEAVVAGTGNRVAADLFEATGPRLLRLIHRVADRSTATRRRLADEHARLAELALRADASGYTTLLRDHVRIHEEESR
jgi:DNA-binding GntR family transcriptional regulator